MLFELEMFLLAKGKKGLVDIISAGTRQIWNRKVPGTQMEKLKGIVEDKYGVKFGESNVEKENNLKNRERII